MPDALIVGKTEGKTEGTEVGFAEGMNVGKFVGNIVGKRVGTCDWVMVGFLDGYIVGEIEGIFDALGFIDLIALGTIEGSIVGLTLGSNDGKKEGDLVGNRLGNFEGIADGSLDGLSMQSVQHVHLMEQSATKILIEFEHISPSIDPEKLLAPNLILSNWVIYPISVGTSRTSIEYNNKLVLGWHQINHNEKSYLHL